jgi:hypothetical protein
MQHATGQITTTHGTVLQVIKRVERLGQKIFMDSYFTSPALFDDLFQQKTSAFGTLAMTGGECHEILDQNL